MGITRTYIVGDTGLVHRLDNLTGPWINISLSSHFPSLLKGLLLDVETDPLDGDKVFAVGSGNSIDSLFGIYVSMDAGATWIIPGGNYQTNIDLTKSNPFNWYEVWVLDSNNIFVAGQNGYVAKSTDGGLTFNLCTQLPALNNGVSTVVPQVYSVHFITPLIGVVGLEEHAAITYDGGTTWIILNGGNPLVGTGTLYHGIAIHLGANQQDIIVCGQSRIFKSTNSGTTFTEVYAWAARNGKHMTWNNDLELWSFGGYSERIKSTDGGSTWSVINAYGPTNPTNNAGHFYQNQNGFYSENRNILTTNNGTVTGITSEAAPNTINAVWTWLNIPKCYLLVDCEGRRASVVISPNQSLIIGKVINWSQLVDGVMTPVPGCWIIQDSPTCSNAIVQSQFQITAIFNDCDTCAPKCFLLQDCAGQLPSIITSTDLSQYLGQTIQLEHCGPTCWTVFQTTNCNILQPVSNITASFTNCIECQPVVPIVPLELHPRKIKPGYDTPGCPPEYTERVNCAFGEALYDDVLKLRYGIEVCCQDETMKWEIKKELLDLKALYDPALCVSSTVDCCPPCGLVATLVVYNPIGCTPPSNVVATIVKDDSCVPPSGLQTAIIIS